MNINLKNKEKLSSAIQTVQSRSHTRLINVAEIDRLTNDVEKKLSALGISLTNARNAEFLFENGHKMPGSYRGMPESTHFRLKRGSKDWFITDIYRGDCNHNRTFKFVNEDKYRHLYRFTF